MKTFINKRNNFSTKKHVVFYKKIFKNSIFIFFSFVNLFIPFFATMMSALNGPYGAIDVIGVGLSVSFITIFNQFLFLSALCIEFIFRNEKQIDYHSGENRSASSNIMLVLSFISMALFIGLSFIYIEFSGIYQNISNSISLGEKYIAIVSVSLLFNGFIYLNIMLDHQEKKWYGWSLLGLMLILNLIFIPLFGVVIDWPSNLSTFGVGLGILVSSFVVFIVTIIFNIIKKYSCFRFNWNKICFFLKKTKNFAINFLLSTLMKSILVMAIALSLGLADRDTPPALMIVKIIWYNSLFFCGFFADGLLYTVEYTRLLNISENQPTSMRTWNGIIAIGTIGTLIISVIFAAISMPLANLYVSHQYESIKNPLDGIWVYHNLAEEVQKYLWSPDGVYNFKLVTKTSTGVTFGVSKAFSVMYTTIYHVLMNSTKLMSFNDIKLNDKFNWKKLISNFIVIAFVMIFVVVFSVVPTNEGFIKTFPGIDAFSFALMVVAIILFLLTIMGHLKKQKK